MSSQAAEINCEGKRVINEKFVIKVVNNNRIGKTITVLFTSFLYDAIWGLSDIRLASGCSGYSMFDDNLETCTKCDPDAFLLVQRGAQICQKCPLLCKTCKSSQKCLTCVEGSALDSAGICAFSDQFKTQLVPITDSIKNCENEIFKLGSLSNRISFA